MRMSGILRFFPSSEPIGYDKITLVDDDNIPFALSPLRIYDGKEVVIEVKEKESE